ncbi:Scarecrow-like protein 33 [Vitis vinifera]|uniref:Scarecrow-like protein 33 n=1 Tax=Vitis vinifera TaxID=29760 RepID=A0A438JXN2_VITVI|nr:Scarecrow-like protein 33 [Vitis vinifera]
MDRPSRGIEFSEDSVPLLSGENLPGGLKFQEPFLYQNNIDTVPISLHPSGSNLASWPCAGVEEDPLADSDFSDIALKYLSQILMEEDLEEKTGMFKESLALEATEKLFHDIIGETYPPPGEENCGNHPSENDSIDFSTCNSNDTRDGNLVEPGRNYDESPHIASQSTSHSFSSSSSPNIVLDGFVNVPMSTLKVPNIFNDRKSVLQFRRGFEEASKFLQNRSDLSVDSANHNTGLLVPNNVMNKVEKKHGGEHFTDGSRERRRLIEIWNMHMKLPFVNPFKMKQARLCSRMVNQKDLMLESPEVSAGKQLQQIRQHASPMGDGMQRLAHYFANALEARLDGSGSQICKAVITKPSAEKAERLHIIDFGVLYGFSWPSLIQRLSTRPGGPPKLRITGIDFPEPGFRPAQRFNAIAQKFETVQVGDLKIGSEEVVIVRCRYRFKNLLDETVVAESPRNIVLNLIRKMNPDIFIHAVVNAACDAPFFMTRFREALFHYSALFDMLENNVPRNILERVVIEREVFGREIMNMIACEGPERIERPETYKQWQIRNERAGFRQLPLDQEIVNIAKERVKSCYHKDFMIDEDGQWLRQGWKGRIIFAITSWKPAS